MPLSALSPAREGRPPGATDAVVSYTIACGDKRALKRAQNYYSRLSRGASINERISTTPKPHMSSHSTNMSSSLDTCSQADC